MQTEIDLTIGSALWGEPTEVQMTYQALRMMHPEVMARTELLAVQNMQNAPKAAKIKGMFEGWFRGTCANSRYIEYFDAIGTSPAREQIFKHARGKIVMVIDPHIFIQLGGVKAVLDYFERNPESKDIVTGPILWDNLRTGTTHFIDVWRGEMWGIWGMAWETPTHKGSSLRFSVYEDVQTKTCVFVSLSMDHKILNGKTVANSFTFPENLPFPGHERVIREMGAYVLDSPKLEFEIPGMGLGMFAMRKDAWVHFHPHSRHFGGEEMYIQEKVRAAGGKAICLSDAAWWHKFRDEEDKIPYPNTYYDKARNYVMELRELGRDIQPVYDEFVLTGRVSNRKWTYLIEDPEAREKEPNSAQLGKAETAVDVYDEVLPIQRDLNQHMGFLRELADKCDHVTEFSKRRESLIAFAASQCKHVVSINTEMTNPLARISIDSRGGDISAFNATSSEVKEIAPTDMLFIDSSHKYDVLKEELDKYAKSVNRWIVMHDTHAHAVTGEDGGVGLAPAIMGFMEMNPQWFIYKHFNHQYGLTVLSRRPEDKPPRLIEPFPKMRGPGTKLKMLNKMMGIVPNDACDCNKYAALMDQWGVAGCRQRREEIVNHIRDNSSKWGWLDKAKAGALALKTGIAKEIPDWTDPYGGLVDLAIRMAADEEADIERRKAAAQGEAVAV